MSLGVLEFLKKEVYVGVVLFEMVGFGFRVEFFRWIFGLDGYFDFRFFI